MFSQILKLTKTRNNESGHYSNNSSVMLLDIITVTLCNPLKWEAKMQENLQDTKNHS